MTDTVSGLGTTITLTGTAPHSSSQAVFMPPTCNERRGYFSVDPARNTDCSWKRSKIERYVVTFRLRLPKKATVWGINAALTYIVRRLNCPIQVSQAGKINKMPITNEKKTLVVSFLIFFFLVFFSYFVLLFLVFSYLPFALLSSCSLSLLRFRLCVCLFPSVLFYRFVVDSVQACVSFYLLDIRCDSLAVRSAHRQNNQMSTLWPSRLNVGPTYPIADSWTRSQYESPESTTPRTS